MVNTDEIQEESRSLVRRQGAIKPSVLFYTLRRFNKSQRQGRPGRPKGKGRGTPVGVSRDTGGTQGGPTPAGFPGPVILDNLGRVVALLQSVLGELSAVHHECSLGALLDRDGPRLSLSTGIGPSGAGEQRANGFRSERVN